MSKSALYNKVIDLRSRTTCYTWGGFTLKESDQAKLADAFILTGYLVYDFAVSVESQSDVLESCIIQWLYRTSRCDILSLYKSCKYVSDQINRSDSYSYDDIRKWFKATWDQENLQLGHFLVPLKIMASWESAEGALARYFQRSFILHWSKVNLELPVAEELEQEYVHFEEGMSTWTFPPHITSVVRDIITEWLTDIQYTNPMTHGPGAVAGIGRASRAIKNRQLFPDSRLRYVYKDWNDNFYNGSALWTRTAQLIFVPKSIKTYRTICAEPAPLQYSQQAIAHDLYDHIRYPHPLSMHVNVRDQKKSRDAARYASTDGKQATIDLSNASDSVHIDLVKQVFRRTSLYKYLIATRSDRVTLPSGRVIAMNKFAPMGSALCFPIECILFAAVCEYCYRKEGYPHNRARYIVYGDDIIVDSTIAPYVVETLQQLHFTVNREKTFMDQDSLFRESCGGEYYSGTDITPTVLSRKFSGLTVDDTPQSINAAIDLANRYYDANAKLCRQIVIAMIKPSDPKRLVPFSRDGSIGLKTNNPSNYHLKRVTVGCDVHVKHRVSVTDYDDMRTASYSAVSSAEALCTWFIDARASSNRKGPCVVHLGKPRARLRIASTPLYTLL